MEGHCSTGQSPQWAVVPMEEVCTFDAAYFRNDRGVKWGVESS